MTLNCSLFGNGSDRVLFLVLPRMLHEHKIIMNVDGMELNVIKIKPPLVFSKEDCTHFVQSLDSILSQSC